MVTKLPPGGPREAVTLPGVVPRKWVIQAFSAFAASSSTSVVVTPS